MSKKDPRVDAYIAKSAPFARPILETIRATFHRGSPKIEETIRWGMPSFQYKGPVGMMSAFKAHVRFGFWKASLLRKELRPVAGIANRTLGAQRITKMSELPPARLVQACVREAVRLNEEGVKTPPRRRPDVARRAPAPPAAFRAALRKNPKALAVFRAFSPSKRREYVEWIAEARQAATRETRIETAVAWIAEGRPRNWKYQRK